MRSLTIDDAQLGTFNLVIAETDKPLWFGPQVEGKLAIYHAKIVGNLNIPCYALMGILIDTTDDEGYETVVYGIYNLTASITVAIDALLDRIKLSQISSIMASKAIQNAKYH